jgi:hypothetical protein
MAKITHLYPQFVKINGKTALRLVYSGNNNYFYYRDGGDWDVDVIRHKDGSMTSASNVASINGCNIRATTEEEWRKCNGEYAPKKFERYGWEYENTIKPNVKTETKNEYKYILIRR